MGYATEATCNKCGHEFGINHGGGFVFHMLRCNKCGIEKDIGFEELGELHLRYLKGLSGPYCVATGEHDKQVQDDPDIEPITEKEYHRGVEAFAGKCKCEGQFRFKAKPRCPKCKSTDFKEVDTGICFD